MLKTKYLLPLILILCLLFAIPAYTADLFGTYDQRIKLTIDHTKIDSDLTHFPITLFMTDSQMQEVFAEFDADEDFDRCAITTSDESTQIYGDCELFDDSESLGMYHVAKAAIVTDADAAGYLYFYYDNDADHNTTYISKSGGTAAQSVWDGNFKAVYHMADGTTSTTLDSTSNNNDGAKKGANEPVEATGKVGQAQDFDGANDYIDLANDLVPGTNATVEAIIRPDTIQDTHIISDSGSAGNRGWFFPVVNDTTDMELRFVNSDDGTNWKYVTSTNADLAIETYYHVAMVKTDTAVTFYKAGSPLTDDGTAVNSTTNNSTESTTLGAYRTSVAPLSPFDGIEDEVRYSDTNRSAAWVKATYNSLWDTLLTYGSEETEAVSGANILFIFSNF